MSDAEAIFVTILLAGIVLGAILKGVGLYLLLSERQKNRQGDKP
jgi:hypothetical protein